MAAEDPRRPHRAPSGLGAAGKSLWRRLCDTYDFEVHELAVVELAARQADDVAALEAAIAEAGVTVRGSAGQPRLNAAVTEVRQGRLALAKILGQLALPAETEPDERPMTARQRQAQKAANARWTARDSLADRRAGRGSVA